MAVLNVLTGVFAFQAFTQTMIREATSFADEIANSIALRSENVRFSDLLETGKAGLNEIENRLYEAEKQESMMNPNPKHC